MRTLLLAATLASFPAIAFAAWHGTDKEQCGYTHVTARSDKTWIYGAITVFRPEAKPDAEGKCSAKSPKNCEFYGCFRR